MDKKIRLYVNREDFGDFCEGCFERDINFCKGGLDAATGADKIGFYWDIEPENGIIDMKILSKYPIASMHLL